MQGKMMVIVNPVSANNRTGKLWPGYQERLKQAGIEFETVYTEYPRHAMSLAAEGLAKGFKRVMAVGGDGTANEVINGLLKREDLMTPQFGLIIFSQGTGCDYIKSLGISNQLEDIIKIIKEGTTRLVDLGLVTYVTQESKAESRYFINLANLGIGAETVYLVNKSTKFLGGFWTYLFGVLRAVFTYHNKQVRLVIDDHQILNEKINSVMVAKGEYVGGGIKIAPGSRLDNGKFKLIVLGNFGKLEIIANLAKAYRGLHLSHPKVSQFWGSRVSLESSEKMMIELDGEIVGFLPAHFEIQIKRLPIRIA